MSDLNVVSDWEVSAYPKGPETSLIYLAPCCGRSHEINVQTPRGGETVETQLWCHAHMRGADATITVA